MRRRFFPVLFIGMLGIFLLGGMRSSAYRTGYFSGYHAAQTAAVAASDGGEAAANPVIAGPQHGYPHYHGYSVFGGFFRFLFFFFFLSFLFKTFMRRHWHMMHGGKHGHYRHWKRRHGGCGPRDEQDDGRSAKEKAADEAADDIGFVPQEL